MKGYDVIVCSYLLQQDRHAHAYGVLQGTEKVWVCQLDHLKTMLGFLGADPSVGLRVKKTQ